MFYIDQKLKKLAFQFQIIFIFIISNYTFPQKNNSDDEYNNIDNFCIIACNGYDDDKNEFLNWLDFLHELQKILYFAHFSNCKLFIYHEKIICINYLYKLWKIKNIYNTIFYFACILLKI